MTRILTTIVLLLGFCLAANADVWMWVDTLGKTHFVDTMTPIFTWVDDFGKVHFSDKPEHEDAAMVQLMWHSSGPLADLDDEVADESDADGNADPGETADPDETAEESAELKKTEEHYCKRATEIYESYLNAPQLYRTGDDGKREYLGDKEAAATFAETKMKKDKLCS